MRTRRLLVATLVSVALATGAIAQTATAAPAAKPSSKFCKAFGEYFQTNFIIQFVAAFAEGLGGEKGKEAAEQLRQIMYLVLSPQLEQVTKRLEADSPNKVARRTFKAQSKVFAAGPKLLVDAGLTEQQVEKLANIDLSADTDVDELLGEVDISKQDIEAAGKKFGPRIEEISDLSPQEERQFRQLGSECGVFPDRSVSCKDVVSEDDVSAIIGPVEKSEDEGGSCTFESAPNADDDTNEVGIDVYKSARAFDTLTKDVKSQDVPSIGDEAVAISGKSTFSDISTCGRTLIIRDGDRTVVVGACVRDSEVDVTQLTDLAQTVLDNLGSG